MAVYFFYLDDSPKCGPASTHIPYRLALEEADLTTCVRNVHALDQRRTCLRMLPHDAYQHDAPHHAPGTLCGVTANVALGPEAPMVHLGGCVAHVITHAACSARPAAVGRPARSLRRMPGHCWRGRGLKSAWREGQPASHTLHLARSRESSGLMAGRVLRTWPAPALTVCSGHRAYSRLLMLLMQAIGMQLDV